MNADEEDLMREEGEGGGGSSFCEWGGQKQAFWLRLRRDRETQIGNAICEGRGGDVKL